MRTNDGLAQEKGLAVPYRVLEIDQMLSIVFLGWIRLLMMRAAQMRGRADLLMTLCILQRDAQTGPSLDQDENHRLEQYWQQSQEVEAN